MIDPMQAWKISIGRTSAILSVSAALVSIQIASAETPTPKSTADAKRHIILSARTDTLPFSDGVLVGDTLYLAGRIGIDQQTGKPPDDLEKETRLLLDGIKATLKEAGMTMDDLVSVQVFVQTSPSTKSSTRFIAPTSRRISPRAPSSAPAPSSAAATSKCRG
jgi:enamine deaminase RidA (YjgF/YER057c/UK114 family)